MITKRNSYVKTNLRASDYVIFVRSRDFDKTLELPFTKVSGQQIWTVRLERDNILTFD